MKRDPGSSDGERPDPLKRLDATTEAVRGLRGIFAAEEPLDHVLTRVAATAACAIPDADAVTITVLTGERPRTAACTDQRVVEIDMRQYAANRGPCLDSARTQRPVRAVTGERREQWPEFDEAAEEAGIRAYLSVPLLVRHPGDGDQAGDHGDRELVGSLNVYSYTAAAFDPFDEGLLRLYATAAAEAIANARRWQQSRDAMARLANALSSRAEIDQAKGVLMALHGCDADEAFARLVEQSQNRNVKVHQLARDLLNSLREVGGHAGKQGQGNVSAS